MAAVAAMGPPNANFEDSGGRLRKMAARIFLSLQRIRRQMLRAMILDAGTALTMFWSVTGTQLQV
jgi:hypothetical protein